MTVTVRYWAAARTAAGVDSEQVEVASVEELSRLLGARGGKLAAVFAASSLLADGVAVTDPHARLDDGATVEVLPPFAGGACRQHQPTSRERTAS